MSFHDRESARLDGSAFGEEVARRTAATMAGVATEDELRAVGVRGIAEVAERADALVRAGLDQALVVAWLESAADAFSTELSGAASLLASPADASSRR